MKTCKTNAKRLVAITVGLVGLMWAQAPLEHPASAPNPIARENVLVGDNGWNRAPSGAVEAYASEVSAGPGQAVQLHVRAADSSRYRIDLYRLGWYGGAGGRLIRCIPACEGDFQGEPQAQPASNATVVRANWPVSATFTIPKNAVSGYYLISVVVTTGRDAGKAAQVPLIVRAPSAYDSSILVEAPVNTWEAYNPWGGRSLYGVNSLNGVAASVVSFDRPYAVDRPTYPAGRNNLFNWEYPAVRFLERNGFDVSYTTDVDVDADPGQLLRHRLVIVLGHDEYWTHRIRAAFDRARDNGVNLAFFGANDGYWQMRYRDQRRTIVEYRSATADPSRESATKTVRFRDSPVSEPECELMGVEHDNGRPSQSDPAPAFSVPAASVDDPWFRGTGFVAGSTLRSLVGYEWDTAHPGCAAGSVETLFHYGGLPVAADSVKLTTRTNEIFSAGTLQFSWGLDSWGGHDAADPRLEALMKNVINDLLRRHSCNEACSAGLIDQRSRR